MKWRAASRKRPTALTERRPPSCGAGGELSAPSDRVKIAALDVADVAISGIEVGFSPAFSWVSQRPHGVGERLMRSAKGAWDGSFKRSRSMLATPLLRATVTWLCARQIDQSECERFSGG